MPYSWHTDPAAVREPIKVGTVAYVRAGTNKKPLSKFPDREAELWRLLDTTPCEMWLAAEDLQTDEVLRLLDYPGYCRYLGMAISSSQEKVLADLENEGFVARNDAGGWNVTSMGALMVASDFGESRALAKRAVRVIQHRGSSRLDGIQEQTFAEGYAISHEEVVRFVMAIIPQEEVLDGAIRRKAVSFPEVAVRELTANMMVHQALDQRGMSPMVEVFDGRIEFSNAGAPFVGVARIIDTVPQLRNGAMAGYAQVRHLRGARQWLRQDRDGDELQRPPCPARGAAAGQVHEGDDILEGPLRPGEQGGQGQDLLHAGVPRERHCRGTHQYRRARAVRASRRRQGEGVPCDSGRVGARADKAGRPRHRAEVHALRSPLGVT